MLNSSILLPPSSNWYGAQLVAAQPSTSQIAYAGHNSVVVADYQTCRVLRTMCGGQSRVTAVAWAPDTVSRHQLVAGHEDGSLRTWDARSGATLRAQKKKGPEVSAVVLLDRQTPLAVLGDAKGGLHTWAFQSANKPQTLPIVLRSKVAALTVLHPAVGAGDAALGPAPPTLVTAACTDGTVSVIDVDAGAVLYCFTAHRSAVQSVSGGTAATTPAVLRDLGAVLLATASGDEGCVKVWQISVAGRAPSATLVTTVGAAGSRQEAGGRHNRQRNTNTQWLSATLLPVCQPEPPGARTATSQEAWVAVAQGGGEVWVHKIHTSSGRADLPFKLHNLHYRPIYGVLAVPVPEDVPGAAARTQAAAEAGGSDGGWLGVSDGSAVSTSAPATHEAPPAPGSTAELQFGSVGAEAPQLGGSTGGVGGPGEGGVTPPPSVMLATISQDRQLTVSRINFTVKRNAPAAAKSNFTKSSKGSKADAAALDASAEPNAAVTAGVPTGNSTAAPPSEAGVRPSSTSAPVPIPAPAATPGFDMSALQQALLAQEGHGAGTSPAKSRGMPVFRVAAGPPADRTQRGFAVRGSRGQSSSGGGPTDPDPVPAPTGSTADVSQPATGPPAPPAPVAPPAAVAPVAPAALQPSALDAAGEVAGGLRTLVGGWQLWWKVPGLGGYGFQVEAHVAQAGVTCDEPAPGSDSAGKQELSGNCPWEVAVGCGDKTVRTAQVDWPVTWEVGRAGAAGDANGPSDGTEAGATVEYASAKGRSVKYTAQHARLRGATMLWRGPTDQVVCVARHPASPRFLAFGCQDGQVGLFDLKVHTPYLFPTRHQGPVTQLAWYRPAGTQQALQQLQDTLRRPGRSESARGSNTGGEGGGAYSDHTPRMSETGEGGGADVSADVDSPVVPPPPADPAQPNDAGGEGAPPSGGKGGKSAGAKAAQDAQQHALCAIWHLVSCGAEGRLLTWALPSPQEFLAAAQSGGMAPTGLPGSGQSRGGADRAGRWGAPAAPVATELPNDLMTYVLPALPAREPAVPGAPGPGPAGVSCLAVLPHAEGDFMVLALHTGALLVLRGSALAAPHASPSLHQGYHHGHHHHYHHGGRGRHGQASTPAVSPSTWHLVWEGEAQGGPPSHLSCVMAEDDSNTLLIAAASAAAVVAVYAASLAPPPAPVAPSRPVMHVPTGSMLTCTAWLHGGAGLVGGNAQDNTVGVWALQGLPGVRSGRYPVQLGAEATADPAVLATPNAALLTSLKGHTDQVMSLSTHTMPPPPAVLAVAGWGDAAGSAGAGGTGSVAWVFSASRDQSVRAWVLDMALLWRQHIQRVQQQKAEAAAQAIAAAEAAEAEAQATAAEGAEEGVQGGEEQAARDGGEADAGGAVGGGERGLTPAAAAGDTVSEGGSAATSVAVTQKSELAGVPGGRPKGSKKPAVLGSKPLLDSAGARVPHGVAADASNALAALERALGASCSAGSGAEEDEAARVSALQDLAARSGDPVAMAVAGQLPRAPERVVMAHLWLGDVKRALQVAVEEQLLSADLVSVAASLGRPAWVAASRLYAAQQEAVGQVHVAVMHLLAIGDRAAAAAVYRRNGLLQEARAVDGTSDLIAAAPAASNAG